MLAIHGGQPVRKSLLSYGQQWIGEEDIEAVVETLRSPMLTQGPMIEEFEKKISEYVGVKYAVAFCNGTAALHAAYYAAGITSGDEVITTPITFVATANSALYLGAKPVFADIDNQTYNLDPKKVEKLITPRTKAIVPVDFTGQPVEYDSFRRLADQYNLVFISDGAHSFGAKYKGQPVGKCADMTMFSFHPVKPITTGEGGVIVTNNPDYYEKLQLFRSHGIKKSGFETQEGPWYYEMVDLGMNYRMTDIQASLGIAQIRKIDKFVKRRQEIASIYNEGFKDEEIIGLPYQLTGQQSGWHLYIIRLNLQKLRVSRKEVFEALRAENIGVNVHYIPVHRHPYYQALNYHIGLCPIAEKWYEEVITIPLFPKMTDEDVTTVITAVKKVVQFYKVD